MSRLASRRTGLRWLRWLTIDQAESSFDSFDALADAVKPCFAVRETFGISRLISPQPRNGAFDPGQAVPVFALGLADGRDICSQRPEQLQHKVCVFAH